MLVLISAIIIALVAAFIILFIDKIGLRNWLIEKSPKLLSKLFSCDFCLSFWVSVILTLIAVFVLGGDMIYLISPILATPITRFLL